MTLPAILPYLAAGRKARRKVWAERPGLAGMLRLGGSCEVALLVADLLATDWELVEETKRETVICLCPGPAGTAHEESCPASPVFRLKQQVSRLTRELEEARARTNALEFDAAVALDKLAQIRKVVGP